MPWQSGTIERYLGFGFEFGFGFGMWRNGMLFSFTNETSEVRQKKRRG